MNDQPDTENNKKRIAGGAASTKVGRHRIGTCMARHRESMQVVAVPFAGPGSIWGERFDERIRRRSEPYGRTRTLPRLNSDG